MDVKAPGDGLLYLVGTIEVANTDPVPVPTLFSTQPITRSALSSGPLNAFTYPFGSRQVVALQIVDPAQQLNLSNQGIVQQRYFYGQGVGMPPFETGSSNARGISVWPAPTPEDTRIAICGEAYDLDLVGSQVPPGAWLGNGAGMRAAGFLAVFDGNATLLWTHHFFTDRPVTSDPNGYAAVTDVSIRVECDATGAFVRDVVTYCGISSYGNAPPGLPPPPFLPDALQPVAPFVAPPGAGVCTSPAGGAIDNGGGNWDGFVGRLSRAHDGSGSTMPQFHSVVGGNEQDGLFGIAEFDENRFVVVGSSGGGPGSGSATFPFTDGTCQATATGSYVVGVALVFDASTVLPGGGGALSLRSANRIGSLDARTVARDVHVIADQPSVDRFYIVGSTDDANLLMQTGALAAPQAVIGGGVDGFLVSGIAIAIAPYSFAVSQTTFRGGMDVDVLTGVQGWNEFVDHVAVTGYVASASDTQIDVGSYYVDTSGTGAPELRTLTSVLVGGSGVETPTAQGPDRATVAGAPSSSFVFAEFGLGDPAGGGITVDQQGRVSVVGYTVSADFPVVGGRMHQGSAADGVRVALDLVAEAVARTDGTGVPAPNTPNYPVAGVPGGTTPDCALAPFGRHLGAAPPELTRMLIDFEGPPPAGGNTEATIVVIRPPDIVVTGAGIMALQLDWPGYVGDTGPSPIVLPEGLVLWTTSSAVPVTVPATPYQTVRVDLLPEPPGMPPSMLPASPFTMSVQLVCLVFPAVTGGVVPSCSSSSEFVGSPALWFTY